MDGRILYVHALSPVHTGTGQSTDVIDLPVAREKFLNWPYLPASSIKGVLRDVCDQGAVSSHQRELFLAAFGPEPSSDAERAGRLWFSDGHLLCLPVRSYVGSFAWITCPLALQRWQRDHLASGMALRLALPAGPDPAKVLVPKGSSALASEGVVYLEDLDLAAQEREEEKSIGEWIARAVFDAKEWQTYFLARFAIVHDDVFSFLAETATEVTARVRILPQSKTVQRGGLWYEEAIPAESIFSCPLLAESRNGLDAKEIFGVLKPAEGKLLQIGGNASVGRGLVEMRVATVGQGEG